jgi:hypothetical protein
MLKPKQKCFDFMDYTIFYKQTLDFQENWDNLPEYDIYISTFDCSDRVKHNFSKIKARNKHWLFTPHHKIPEDKRIDEGEIFEYPLFNDDEFLIEYFNAIAHLLKDNPKICIDITGFIRPFIVFLIRYINSLGFKKIDIIYGEPNKYIHSDETEFSGFVDIVRTVPGCASSDLLPSSENDVLIIAAGYDDKLISAVAEAKRHCDIKYQIYGFPSLQPDMYQESVLRVHNARESMGAGVFTSYSPAFDPFVTAQKLKEIIDLNLSIQKTNIYISPLSTKPQVLGFILYYLYEGINKPVNIIFPYSQHYSINTCSGINKTWYYQVELP